MVSWENNQFTGWRDMGQRETGYCYRCYHFLKCVIPLIPQQYA